MKKKYVLPKKREVIGFFGTMAAIMYVGFQVIDIKEQTEYPYCRKMNEVRININPLHDCGIADFIPSLPSFGSDGTSSAENEFNGGSFDFNKFYNFYTGTAYPYNQYHKKTYGCEWFPFSSIEFCIPELLRKK